MNIQFKLISNSIKDLNTVSSYLRKHLLFFFKFILFYILKIQYSLKFKFNTFFYLWQMEKKLFVKDFKYTLLRSSHIFKRAQEHFLYKNYSKRFKFESKLKMFLNLKIKNIFKKLILMTISTFKQQPSNITLKLKNIMFLIL